MTLEIAVAAALFVGVLAYALFAGADFGSGFFDLTAGGPSRGAEMRSLVDHSIGPVWEANHVWLIFCLVTWWTGFPRSFAAMTTTLFIPLALALAGIVLRGAAFAFRKYAPSLGQARLYGAVFAGSSLVTPFFLGTVAGAIASGRVPAEGYGDRWSSWLNPVSLFGGVIAVGTCAFLAGTFLCADAERTGHGGLIDTLRRRTLGVGVITGLVVFAALIPIRQDAPTLARGLERQAAPLIVISAIAGVTTLGLLWRRRFSPARITAVAAVATVISGWGVGQYPWLLVDQVRINDAGGARSTLIGLIIAVGCATVVVLPPLAGLYWFTQSEHLDEADAH
ncbi:cytochrome d ubiquinol oxidase subunit II [Nocardioides sp. CER19]|uniref:cytochrome d ubiquinol oxidase subunit II n=1 Tax=Nocardioides sp. CER19 TaxID=3038538 RepID=UPI002446995E|nr:cytochrome d ubiquinol oxidase subunit II [Nocardioides sp. CER19]MDH2413910.1 cytochrome d ubiquinol oxidase subunit II [Nocardioides sp. CER19]